VPIVRHHHESWNGCGYPSGIAGTDIPIGARILSVVDCFDALTSDRPYRPRLTPEEAFAILRERRGTMYDPLVVDTFIKAYPDIAPAAIQAGQEARSIFPVDLRGGASLATAPLRQIRANAAEAALLITLEHDLAAATSLRSVMEMASQCLRQLTPVVVLVLYRYDPDSDHLICDAAIGDPNRLLNQLTIRLGERVSGWCAANLRGALNSDATLDLGQIANAFDPALRSILCAPAVVDERLVGVVTAYATREEAFSESHRYALERIAELVAAKTLALGAGRPNIYSFPRKN
jgi:putative methionine-R-sulfoxide reductase with GAF domain